MIEDRKPKNVISPALALTVIFNITWEDTIFPQDVVLTCKMLGCLDLKTRYGMASAIHNTKSLSMGITNDEVREMVKV